MKSYTKYKENNHINVNKIWWETYINHFVQISAPAKLDTATTQWSKLLYLLTYLLTYLSVQLLVGRLIKDAHATRQLIAMINGALVHAMSNLHSRHCFSYGSRCYAAATDGLAAERRPRDGLISCSMPQWAVRWPQIRWNESGCCLLEKSCSVACSLSRTLSCWKTMRTTA